MAVRGTPSDDLPAVLATGVPDANMIFVSMSAREPTGRDREYLEWHSLDHRPEQYRIKGLRHSIRVVSTTVCRAVRAATDPSFDAVDHVMTYFFTDTAACDQFGALSQALTGDRRPWRLPSVCSGYFRLRGKVAAPRAVSGADVMPWRPARGLYLLVERGRQSPAALTDVAGVAGVWWFEGGVPPTPKFQDNSGLQLAYCFLDDDPIATGERLRGTLERRWAATDIVPLLAAPFHTLVPFEWDRFLP
jgi:hypothetical protein